MILINDSSSKKICLCLKLVDSRIKILWLNLLRGIYDVTGEGRFFVYTSKSLLSIDKNFF